MMKTLRYFFAAALAMVGMNAVAGNATATLTFPATGGESISAYTKEWTATVDGFDWVLNGFNSNKNAWAYVKCGRKDNAQTASITSPAVNAVITDFVVSIDKTANVESANVTIEGSDQIIDVTAQFLAGDMDVKLTNHVAGKKITLTINSTAASANGPTQISKVALYEAGQYEEVHIANTPETAYTVAKAFELIDAAQALGETVYVKGTVSKVDKFNDDKTITYWISDDGTTTKQLEAYKGKGVNGAEFASIDDVAVGATVIVKGTLTKYTPSSGDPIYEFNANNEMYSYEAPAPATETVWDFTVLPTAKIDGAGNIETNAADGIFVEDEGAAWQQAYNKADLPDGTEFISNADGTVFEPTKHLVWSAMSSNKTVFYRNYPDKEGARYGGKHLFFNKEAEVMIPCKAGQVIEMMMTGSKVTTKKITSQDVVETFDDEGTPVGGVKLDITTAYGDYFPVTLTAKVENVYLTFQSTLCIQKITVKDGGGAGIAAVKAANKFAGTQMYNLAGQKVGKDYKGIVIVNGKKVVLK